MQYIKRKTARLEGFDYNTPGIYFITICTYKRRMLFWDNPMRPALAPGTDRLNFAGRIADNVIKTLPDIFPVTIEKYVIMPNHIHLLLLIKNDNSIKTKTGLVSRTVSYLKMKISHELHNLNVDDSIWQRSFHDHIIRNENDYIKIWEYIENNPIKWESDCFFESLTFEE